MKHAAAFVEANGCRRDGILTDDAQGPDVPRPLAVATPRMPERAPRPGVRGLYVGKNDEMVMSGVAGTALLLTGCMAGLASVGQMKRHTVLACSLAAWQPGIR